jgi:hypothetical protein
VLINTSSFNGNSTAAFSAWTNADLGSITERTDNTNTAGLGGGHGLATGTRVTAGAYGNTTVTLANTSFKGAMSIALEPDDNFEQIRVDVSWDGGTHWSNKATTTTTGTEATYWYDVTGATAWTPAKLADGQLQVRADAQTVNSASTVSLDWLSVEVTYDTMVTGSRWDALFWDESLATGTDITFAVRASDTVFLKDAVTPSWTSVGGTSPVISGLPAGKYKQWRATLTPDGPRTSTPTLAEARVYYYGG